MRGGSHRKRSVQKILQILVLGINGRGYCRSLLLLSAPPTLTPYTVSPAMRNRAEVARALQREYPALLRDAGIGGTVTVWFFVDEDGKVIKIQVNPSSGHQALDDAAIRVAGIMEFTPALNRDKRVSVWISLLDIRQKNDYALVGCLGEIDHGGRNERSVGWSDTAFCHVRVWVGAERPGAGGGQVRRLGFVP